MYANYRSIKKAHMMGNGSPENPCEAVKKAQELGFDINPAYVITPERKPKLTKSQKKSKAIRRARKSKMYNLLHR